MILKNWLTLAAAHAGCDAPAGVESSLRLPSDAEKPEGRSAGWVAEGDSDHIGDAMPLSGW